MQRKIELSFDSVVANPKLLHACLEQHGACLVKGVVPNEATTAGWRASALAWVASLGRRCDLSSPEAVYDAPRWPHHPHRDDPIFAGYGAGHLPAAWEARLHPRVQQVFAAVHGTEQLVTSFDAINLERPRRERRSDSAAVQLHTDQRRSWAGARAECIQGVLSVTQTTARTGGTTLVLGARPSARRQPPSSPVLSASAFPGAQSSRCRDQPAAQPPAALCQSLYSPPSRHPFLLLPPAAAAINQPRNRPVVLFSPRRFAQGASHSP